MSYKALYRTYRPQTFKDVTGQEVVVKTLQNAISNKKISHAYLFSGPRGTGKTSVARIFAKALNCVNESNGEPCDNCISCSEISEGYNPDVIEIDAASNNGVDEIRDIREKVKFLPSGSKYKIYIIDEVHMLSGGAFNALLKTLEEPPEHVKFILATTEPQKLLATILSRCQRFDFKRISIEDIAKRLRIICKESNIEITDEALQMIAVLAEGALRDGISILERCSQDTEGVIDEDKIRDLVGMPRLTHIKEIVKSMIDKSPETAVEVTNKIIAEGKDLDNFLWEIIKYIKDTFVYKTTNTIELYSKEDIDFIKNLSENASKEDLLNMIYKLSELSNNMKSSTQKNIIFQAGIIKECIEFEKQEYKTIIYKEETLQVQKPKEETKKEVRKTEVKKPEIQEIQGIENSKNYVPYWKNVLDKIRESGKMTVYANLIGTKGVLINDLIVGIEFPGKVTDFAKKILEDHNNKTTIEKIVSMEQGSTMQIKILDGKEKIQEKRKQGIEGLAEEMDLPFNVIDG